YLATNQGVVGSNPASRARKIKGLQIFVCKPLSFSGFLPHFLPLPEFSGCDCGAAFQARPGSAALPPARRSSVRPAHMNPHRDSYCGFFGIRSRRDPKRQGRNCGLSPSKNNRQPAPPETAPRHTGRALKSIFFPAFSKLLQRLLLYQTSKFNLNDYPRKTTQELKSGPRISHYKTQHHHPRNK
uniref:hypothetical protein n=1 Tax=Castellaniella defragrans TaxID=75697 RepID=UPI00333F40DC